MFAASTCWAGMRSTRTATGTSRTAWMRSATCQPRPALWRPVTVTVPATRMPRNWPRGVPSCTMAIHCPFAPVGENSSTQSGRYTVGKDAARPEQSRSTEVIAGWASAWTPSAKSATELTSSAATRTAFADACWKAAPATIPPSARPMECHASRATTSPNECETGRPCQAVRSIAATVAAPRSKCVRAMTATQSSRFARRGACSGRPLGRSVSEGSREISASTSGSRSRSNISAASSAAWASRSRQGRRTWPWR
mmetsp:Transcript_53336/g.150351  ORF Transcript_53336/g.150351 Transcript_53336/m.150351 type:complete len:254 (-) Transcript_53336:162-923(-)